jgi:hypothetical protein
MTAPGAHLDTLFQARAGRQHGADPDVAAVPHLDSAITQRRPSRTARETTASSVTSFSVTLRSSGPTFTGSSRQLPLDLVEPIGVGLHDAPGETVVEEQVVLAAGDRGGDCLRGVESGGDVGDLLA